MHIHLIGGFLGSGKTTAINSAAQILTNAGEVVAVITNDQGTQLVDTRFIQQSAIQTAEVTGGCFCCNYHDLDAQINRLENEIKPTVIFAETVGSCTDLIATVLMPLLQFKNQHKISYSGFVDAALLLMYLQEQSLPFLPETNYIWQKQLEEAGILVVNKCDLLKNDDLDRLKELAQAHFPDKNLLFQNSLDGLSVNGWLQKINAVSIHNYRSVEIDYETYAAGEANLTWLDAELEFFTGNLSAAGKAETFIRRLADKARQNKWPVGHLKFFVVNGHEARKISFTLRDNADFTLQKSNAVKVLVNARVQTTPDELQKVFGDILSRIKSDGDVIINQKNLSCFQPGYPVPVYRMA